MQLLFFGKARLRLPNLYFRVTTNYNDPMIKIEMKTKHFNRNC